MFESFGELIDLRRRRDSGALQEPRLSRCPFAPSRSADNPKKKKSWEKFSKIRADEEENPAIWT